MITPTERQKLKALKRGVIGLDNFCRDGVSMVRITCTYRNLQYFAEFTKDYFDFAAETAPETLTRDSFYRLLIAAAAVRQEGER